ncbi:MAG: Gfo/Idh/MocA family protein [Gemmobacter sp.]
MLRIGVVGYGTGGQHFHTPFIAAARGCALAGIVARAPETVARARADWPDTPVFPSLAAMITAGVCDAVTITTPPQTRRDLVLEAVAAGLHVIADKPFAPDAAGAMELDRAAKAKGVTLGVYQNRRFDADLKPCAKSSATVGSAASGGSNPAWIRTGPTRWNRGPRGACCATLAAMSSIR